MAAESSWPPGLKLPSQTEPTGETTYISGRLVQSDGCKSASPLEVSLFFPIKETKQSKQTEAHALQEAQSPLHHLEGPFCGRGLGRMALLSPETALL